MTSRSEVNCANHYTIEASYKKGQIFHVESYNLLLFGRVKFKMHVSYNEWSLVLIFFLHFSNSGIFVHGTPLAMAGLKWSLDVAKRWFPNLSCHLTNLATALKIITAHKIWKIGVDSQLHEGTIQEKYVLWICIGLFCLTRWFGWVNWRWSTTQWNPIGAEKNAWCGVSMTLMDRNTSARYCNKMIPIHTKR